MAQNSSITWEADKMLDVYIHDYLLKRKLLASAKAFMDEGKVAAEPVAIDAPGGFLFEWWSVFWDLFISRTNEKHSEAAVAYIEAQQMKRSEQQKQMQQLQIMQQRNAQMQHRDPNYSPLGGPINAMNSEGMMGQPSSRALAMKMYEERMKNPHSMNLDTSTGHLDANSMAFLKSAANHQGQSMQGNSGSMAAALQQIQSRNSLNSMDHSSLYGQAILQSKSGPMAPGVNQGVAGIPLKGWPLTGIDPTRPNLGVQIQKPNMQNQYLMASQQQAWTPSQSQPNLGNSASYGDMDPRRFGGLPRGTSFSAREGQSTRNDGSISSPGQSSSPKMKMTQLRQSSSQQQQQPDQMQQQQLQQGNKKRKQHTSSGPANSTGTGNTVGPSANSPQSSHTHGDGMTTASSLQHVNNASKNSVNYGQEGIGGLATSSNLLDDMEHFADVGSLDDNVESFLSHDAGEGRELYGTLKQNSNDQRKESSKSFSFSEFGSIRTRGKVTCCHFSSDGSLLATAGHDKKAVLWKMDTLKTESTSEEHQAFITDIRFRANSSQLATASYDKSVRLWDAANPSYCLQAYTGHSSPIMSLDFHPKMTDLFCFCDEKNEIRYWRVSPFALTHVSKGRANTQVRFQPRIGKMLATASDKIVSVYDVETDRPTHSFKGHFDNVSSICWDVNGDHLASVSPNVVKIWALNSGDCIHELPFNGNQFHSCAFHPSFSNLLVVGGISSLELWDFAENKSMTVPAHENTISSLAQSLVTGMVASGSHDGSIKLWK